MPLTIQAPALLGAADRRKAKRLRTSAALTVGLVNNMPDSALEATEAQFSRLLQSAAGPLPVQLRLCYLPEVARSPQTLDHLLRNYWPIDALLKEPLDGLIVTGMEPGPGALNEEPYWKRFGQLIEWAQAHTVSSVWSCLAAHAAVLKLDGIARQRLEHKRFGVFEHALQPGHPLVAEINAPLCIPHSRWNELPVAALRTAGYTILSSSPESGADLFVRHGRSLLVFFQGHPEYDETSLLKEYRRDVGRFLRGQQASYPSLPRGYFNDQGVALLEEFRSRALADAGQDPMASFPEAAVAQCLNASWRDSAAQIYRNWLAVLAAAREPVRSPAVAEAS
ncbi:MAG TPA: homoserine O-succinyltransferase [Steroidobacteraceae bacterium]|nr:homoserine O-succinyltransferase [Steroidobacteraceae bacterium]